MPELIYSPEAESDLIEIWLYIAEDKDPETADRVLSSVWDKCNALLKHPEMGRRREELAPGLRSIPKGSYVVFYRQAGDRIEIVRVLHGARDIEQHLQGN
ncbi:MAG: toxin ParE1/3/4 [Blastocatellia bacterium]|nr:toxin ParE1/3/4 [Blastocatellia bacterium]